MLVIMPTMKCKAIATLKGLENRGESTADSGKMAPQMGLARHTGRCACPAGSPGRALCGRPPLRPRLHHGAGALDTATWLGVLPFGVSRWGHAGLHASGL